MISIILPFKNAEHTISQALNSIFRANSKNTIIKEIILVNNNSTDNTVEILKRYKGIKLIECKKNSVSAARNSGAKVANGKYILFIDADVVVPDDAFIKLKKYLDKDISIGCGHYHFKPLSPFKFANYKALFDYYYNMNLKDTYTTELDTCFFIIKKELFFNLKGFNEELTTADFEDNELGYRSMKHSKIILFKDIPVHHYFPDFFNGLKKYFFRAYYWIKFFKERKKFDNLYSTKKNAILSILSFFILVSIFISKILFLSLLTVFYLLQLNFIIFLFKKTKNKDFIIFLFFNYIQYLTAFSGALFGWLEIFFQKLNILSK